MQDIDRDELLRELARKVGDLTQKIESAFIKAETKINFLRIEVPTEITNHIQSNSVLKIKIEIDTKPPKHFNTQTRDLFRPIPFNVVTMTKPCLFAGKLHAVLARNWKARVKGRDFFEN